MVLFSCFPQLGKLAIRTYSRTNKVAARPPELQLGGFLLSDYIHVGLLPEKPVRSHFAFALEGNTQINKFIDGEAVGLDGGVEGGRTPFV